MKEIKREVCAQCPTNHRQFTAEGLQAHTAQKHGSPRSTQFEQPKYPSLAPSKRLDVSSNYFGKSGKKHDAKSKHLMNAAICKLKPQQVSTVPLQQPQNNQQPKRTQAMQPQRTTVKSYQRLAASDKWMIQLKPDTKAISHKSKLLDQFQVYDVMFEHRQFKEKGQTVDSILIAKSRQEHIWLSVTSFKAFLDMVQTRRSGMITESKFCVKRVKDMLSIEGPSISGKSYFNMDLTYDNIGKLIDQKTFIDEWLGKLDLQ